MSRKTQATKCEFNEGKQPCITASSSGALKRMQGTQRVIKSVRILAKSPLGKHSHGCAYSKRPEPPAASNYALSKRRRALQIR